MARSFLISYNMIYRRCSETAEVKEDTAEQDENTKPGENVTPEENENTEEIKEEGMNYYK